MDNFLEVFKKWNGGKKWDDYKLLWIDY
jgi:hypothetical protein